MSISDNKIGIRRGVDNKAGLIFHIIHGSFVDGYGVRTTVFLGMPSKVHLVL